MMPIDPCQCGNTSCPSRQGMVRDRQGFWRYPTADEVRNGRPEWAEGREGSDG